MNTPVQLQHLVTEIVRDFPSAQLEWEPFPSGVRVLSVSLNGRCFELDYHPTQGTGVSQNLDDTPPFVGHDEAFPSLEDGIARFKALLADAACTNVHAGSAFVLNDKPTSP